MSGEVRTVANEWTREKIVSLPTSDLQAIVRSTKPDGVYAAQVVWARNEIGRRAQPC